MTWLDHYITFLALVAGKSIPLLEQARLEMHGITNPSTPLEKAYAVNCAIMDSIKDRGEALRLLATHHAGRNMLSIASPVQAFLKVALRKQLAPERDPLAIQMTLDELKRLSFEVDGEPRDYEFPALAELITKQGLIYIDFPPETFVIRNTLTQAPEYDLRALFVLDMRKSKLFALHDGGDHVLMEDVGQLAEYQVTAILEPEQARGQAYPDMGGLVELTFSLTGEGDLLFSDAPFQAEGVARMQRVVRKLSDADREALRVSKESLALLTRQCLGAYLEAEPLQAVYIGQVDREAHRRRYDAERSLKIQAKAGESLFKVRRLVEAVGQLAPVALKKHSEPSGRHVSVQYEVAPFKRMQACGPGRKDRKEVWVTGHVRGPKDAPLKPRKQTLNRVEAPPDDQSHAG